MVLESILGSIGKAFVKKMTEDFVSYAKLHFKKSYDKAQIESDIMQFYINLKNINKVKTLWQPEKAVDIDEFYCDTKVSFEGKPKYIKSISDLDENHNFLIQGIAGQGKSILLRHLCVYELDNGEYLPIYLEIRDIYKKENLFFAILFRLMCLGFESIDEEKFKTLCKIRKVALLLDGFDEISNNDKDKLRFEIEEMAQKFDNVKFIVTSRPNCPLAYSPLFNLISLAPLENNDYETVIKKLVKNDDYAKKIITCVQERESVKGVLTTPLMVTLLVITYKSHIKIPDSLSEFYQRLFQALLERHDSTSKPTYTRPRKCQINDMQYRKIFNTLCYLTKKNRDVDFKTLYICAQKSIEKIRIDMNPKDYIDDIVEITCLILNDGDDYRFIHKSVQEFYAASFISEKHDSWAEQFYSLMLKSDGMGWLQELLFLVEIDNYRFNKYFLMPLILKKLGESEECFKQTIIRTTLIDANRIIGDVDISFRIKNDPNYYEISSISWNAILEMFIPRLDGVLSKTLFGCGGNKFCRIHKNKINTYSEFSMTMKELHNDKFIDTDYIKLADRIRNIIFEHGKEICKGIALEEKEEVIEFLDG